MFEFKQRTFDQWRRDQNRRVRRERLRYAWGIVWPMLVVIGIIVGSCYMGDAIESAINSSHN